MPEADLELLTLLCVDGCSQTQAAHVLGCTQQQTDITAGLLLFLFQFLL